MKKLLLYFFLSSGIATMASAQDAVATANRFLATLSQKQLTETQFPFDSDERYNFHFVPKERKGITFNEMTDEQKNIALVLLKTCLSEKAFQKTQDIMRLDQVLKVLEKRKEEDHYRDTGNYHISIFGIPAGNTIWGWRFEGHHISFTFSFDKQTLVAGTPGFLGSNPGIVQEGPQKGKQVLKEETEMGFALLHSLTPKQVQKAIIATTAPADIASFNKRNATPENEAGIGFYELQPEQQQLFLQLINQYVQRYTRLFAEDMRKEIQDEGLGKLHFAWAGSMENSIGNPHYYRVTGPTILIEYDNTQNNANHVHSVIRDLKHDFGGDLLLEHYQKEHTH